MTNEERIDMLMGIHYGFYMSNPRFWYDKELQEEDKILCVEASNLRLESGK